MRVTLKVDFNFQNENNLWIKYIFYYQGKFFLQPTKNV